MNNREQFEVWYLESWGHTEDNHESLFERCHDGDTYYRLGVRMAYESWQAASKASEQQLAAVVVENAGLKDYYRDTPALKRMGWPKTPATDAAIANIQAQGVDMFGQYHNFSEKLFIQKEAKKFAAQLRQGAAL